MLSLSIARDSYRSLSPVECCVWHFCPVYFDFVSLPLPRALNLKHPSHALNQMSQILNGTLKSEFLF